MLQRSTHATHVHRPRPTIPTMRTRVLAACVTVGLLTVAGLAAGQPSRPATEPFLGLPETSSRTNTSAWTTVEAFPNLTFNDPVFMIPDPSGQRLYVTEREGRIVAFENDDATTEKTVILDLRDSTQGDSDSGMLSMAFHPDYAVSGAPGQGRLFVAYAYREGPLSEDPTDNLPLQFRISSFQVPPGEIVADPNSELILIEQLDQHLWHQGGAIFFHPGDGFLYITLGDEGGGRCGFENCQRIDGDLFGGVLRIDVDQIGGAVSSPIRRQPSSGSTANYYIPNDNPFFAAEGVLEEFYALGLRSPHRMTHDPVDDLTWIADVGQNQREEIDILAPGANFQWNIREGDIPFRPGSETPDPVIGIWTDPVHSYGRGTGGTVIGGYVYRGTLFPELYGKYIYGDFLGGWVAALSYRVEEDEVQLISREVLATTGFRGRTDGITSFGIDENNELYLLTLGEESKIQRLVRNEGAITSLPLTLSGTGLFLDLNSLTPRDELVPYSINSPLWSDGAAKARWMAVPSESTIEFSADAGWIFPAGTVFVKHFELARDQTNPSLRQRLETRVLVIQRDQRVYGATYRWRDDQTDADLVVTGQIGGIDITQGDGSTRQQFYFFPGPGDCRTCHGDGQAAALGLKARQLINLEVDDSLQSRSGSKQGAAEQLTYFSQAGFFDAALDQETLDSIEGMEPLDNEDAPLQTRVRSYLDSNCSHCHGTRFLNRSLWDARFTTPLNRQGILFGQLLGDYGRSKDRVIAPGDLDSSILYLRSETTNEDLRMPPLGRSERDEEFIEVLERWVLGLQGLESTTTTTTLLILECGDPAEPYGVTSAADALSTLRAAVLLQSCDLCVCDVNADGAVTAGDALFILRAAVGLTDNRNCASCF